MPDKKRNFDKNEFQKEKTMPTVSLSYWEKHCVKLWRNVIVFRNVSYPSLLIDKGPKTAVKKAFKNFQLKQNE